MQLIHLIKLSSAETDLKILFFIPIEATNIHTSKEFRKFLENLNIIQSFSTKGYFYDNAIDEVFFKFLKIEKLIQKSFISKAELELSLFEYIESFYKSKRLHSDNNMLSPKSKKTLF